MSTSFRSARHPDTSAGTFDSRLELHGGCPMPDAESESRELHRRSSAGVDVTLCWHPTPDEPIEVQPWLLRQLPTEGGQ
jgi:hypothetical protein